MIIEKHTNYSIYCASNNMYFWHCGDYSSGYYTSWRAAQNAIPDLCKQTSIKGIPFFPSFVTNMQEMLKNGTILYLFGDHALFFPFTNSGIMPKQLN